MDYGVAIGSVRGKPALSAAKGAGSAKTDLETVERRLDDLVDSQVDVSGLRSVALLAE